jgi:HDOD domain
MLAWFRSLFAPRRAAVHAPSRATPRAAPVAAPVEAPLTVEDTLAAIGGVAGSIPDPALVADLAERILAELASSDLAIPPFPSSAGRVLELVAQPALDLNELVRVLHWEPSVVAEIVRVANSCAYGRDGFDDLRGALIALGMTEVGSIAASVAARSLFEVGSRAELALFPERWHDVHRDALVVAFTASWLAQARNLPRYDRVFLRSVIAGTAPMLALRALAVQLLDGRCPRPAAEAISAAVDAVRAQAYDMAIVRWALPPSVASVVDPASQTERQIVELVTSIVELRRHPERVAVAVAACEHARALGLDARWLRVLVAECDTATERVTAILAPPAGPARASGKPRPVAPTA